MPDNPFVPSFGVTPLYLAGREDALSTVTRVSLDFSRMDYSRASLLVGPRGIGKTVLLNAVEDTARDNGWMQVNATASKGFLARMVSEQLVPLLAGLKPERTTKMSAELRVGPPSIASGALRIEETGASSTEASFRTVLFEICAAAPDQGVLFTIDEINNRARDELEEFATVYQHAIRLGLNVAVVMCGIPASLSPLLNEDKSAFTFLNRARRVDVDLLPLPVAKRAFESTIGARGTRSAEPAVIERMARMSRGYPFLVQEVGNKAWDADPFSPTITLDHVNSIEKAALQAMDDSVLRPIYRALPDRLQDLLNVLARDENQRSGELAQALGVPATAMGGLQQRLLATGVVVREERGKLRIVIPYLARYVRSLGHADASDLGRIAILDEYDSDEDL